MTALGKVVASSVPLNPGQSDKVEISCLNSIARDGFLATLTNPDTVNSFAKVSLRNCAGATATSGTNATIVNLGGNLSQFNLRAGDYHEAPDSPTIDAGLLDAAILPKPDIDGGSRTVGASPDIGADEFNSAEPIVDSGSGRPSGADAVVTGSVPSRRRGDQCLRRVRPDAGVWEPDRPGRCGQRLHGRTAHVPGEDRVITYPDGDRDGFFANVDCNDAIGAIRPGAAEIVGNKVDENCDGNPIHT